MMDLRLRAAMEKDILQLIESSEGAKDWLAEKLMDYFEDNAVYITGAGKSQICQI